ncbi:hypothetical protein PCASD_21537 [Puccinia coronata f. sp. avenae]|uniref:Uncharacterized protein n=1 Tax=Puccinia coronata f. sp. avenae TaxID=200324 RepID=A0A2N5TT88_9BASI|nr:hypothetical protein PCASD_21537 [Puccinia coronata f. sp. avenae]
MDASSSGSSLSSSSTVPRSHPPRGRHATMRTRLYHADLRIHGPVSHRLQEDRERLLEEENAHKEHMEAIANFRKSEIIPTGKLQRAMDESESESEPLSESEDTASGAHHPHPHHAGDDDEEEDGEDIDEDDDGEEEAGMMMRVDQTADSLPHPTDHPRLMPLNHHHHDDDLDDLDAQLEDLDNDLLDHSAQSDQIHPSNQSFPSFQTDDNSQ